MSDDLILLISYVYEEQLCKMALKIKHGLNSDFYDKFKYFKETDIMEQYETFMDIEFDFIVAVEEIDHIEITR